MEINYNGGQGSPWLVPEDDNDTNLYTGIYNNLEDFCVFQVR